MEEVRAVILREVLSDFQTQGLEARDLTNSYKGPSTKRLEAVCIAGGFGRVDFELALKELEDEKLIGTGPMELMTPYIPGVTIMPFFHSKREFAYLKKDGYKAASKINAPRSMKPTPSTVFHGDQIINYGYTGAIGRQSAGTINFQQQSAANQFDFSQVASELQMLRFELMKTAKTAEDFQKLRLFAEVEQYAEKQDGSKVMESLSKSGRWLFDFATHLGTELTAKLIAKSIGLEP